MNSARSVHDHSREQLYSILSNDDDLTAKRRAIVDLGADYLGVQLGFVSAIDTESERFEVLVSSNDALLAEGMTYDLQDTYCRRCVESDSSLAVSDVPSADWQGDSAYEEHGLDCYLGTPIYVEDELVGTLCFADTDPRETEFSPSERAFVELAARLLGREHEVRRYERTLDNREQRLDERQHALDTSEQKYEALMTTAPDAIFVAREDSGEIVEVNDATETLYGASAADLIGATMDVFHPGETGRHWAELHRFIADGDGTLSRFSDGSQVHIQRADGTLVPVEVSAERVEIDGTAYVQGIFRDITDRLQQEQDARQQRRQRETTERKYESLVAAAPNAMLMVDMENRRIVEVNDAAVDLTGYTEAELLSESVETVHPDGEAERYMAAFAESLEDGTTRGELPDGSPVLVERKDGTTVPVEISLTQTTIDGRTHAIGILRDVTERRERERELRLKNRAINEASIGITIAAADGDYPLVYANDEFQRTTGYEWAELENQNCRFLQGDRTDEASIATIRQALDAEEPVRTELLNYRKNGTPFWNELSLAPVEDPDGTTTHFIGFQQDVTDRKRKETLITVLNRVLRHNLRNGMSVIGSRAAQLSEELDGHSDAVAAIRSRVDKLTQVGEMAADISKSIEDGNETRQVDVVPLISSVADRLADEGATVDVDIPDSQSVLTTDSLRVALNELGTNALDHAGPDPHVAFSVEETDDDRIAIRVSDDGPGLPPQEQKVLERGYETPLEHGSGLGLWFVTWVVTGVGGHVSADVEDGTTVTLWLHSGDAQDERGQQSAI
jgi:PAS domain S-box-containing protein